MAQAANPSIGSISVEQAAAELHALINGRANSPSISELEAIIARVGLPDSIAHLSTEWWQSVLALDQAINAGDLPKTSEPELEENLANEASKAVVERIKQGHASSFADVVLLANLVVEWGWPGNTLTMGTLPRPVSPSLVVNGLYPLEGAEFNERVATLLIGIGNVALLRSMGGAA